MSSLCGENWRRQRVVLSLGSNVADRRAALERALAALAALPETTLTASSAIVETEPVDVPEAFREMKFLNLVAFVETGLEAHAFSSRIHAIEDALGRVRTIRNGPRTIDIDIIDFDGIVLNEAALTLPHPRAMSRAFVTEPWKALVRKVMKAKRAAVPSAERARASARVCAKAAGLLEGVRLVCCYEALKTELDMGAFIAACRSRGIEVVFPKAEGLVAGVPAGRCAYSVERAAEVDLWVCPGLAFTAKGERIGFGGGWYDRFLAQAKPTARKIGVGYAFQVVPALPQGPRDIRLDAILLP